MKKELIHLRGASDRGKTHTIRRAAKELMFKYAMEGEITLALTINGFTIGIASEADDPQTVERNCNFFKDPRM